MAIVFDCAGIDLHNTMSVQQQQQQQHGKTWSAAGFTRSSFFRLDQKSPPFENYGAPLHGPIGSMPSMMSRVKYWLHLGIPASAPTQPDQLDDIGRRVIASLCSVLQLRCWMLPTVEQNRAVMLP